MSIKNQDGMISEKRDALSQAASLMGKKGGPAAAKIRFSKMSPEQRTQHGRDLVAARWENKRVENKCDARAQEVSSDL